jgi:hypothetical protein
MRLAQRRLTAIVLVCGLVGCGPVVSTATIGTAPKAMSPEPVPDKINASDDPHVIVSKALDAVGGVAKLNRWNVGKVTYKLSMPNSPIEGAETTNEDTFQLPGHFKRVTHGEKNGEKGAYIWVLNNGSGWEKRDSSAPTEIVNPATERTRHLFAENISFAALVDSRVKLTVLGDAKVGDRAVVVVKAEPEGAAPVDCYFEKTTAFVLKFVKVGPDPRTKKDATLTTYLDDYKMIQGGMVPMRIRGFAGDQPLTDVLITDLQFYDKLDASEFAKP